MRSKGLLRYARLWSQSLEWLLRAHSSRHPRHPDALVRCINRVFHAEPREQLIFITRTAESTKAVVSRSGQFVHHAVALSSSLAGMYRAIIKMIAFSIRGGHMTFEARGLIASESVPSIESSRVCTFPLKNTTCERALSVSRYSCPLVLLSCGEHLENKLNA